MILDERIFALRRVLIKIGHLEVVLYIFKSAFFWKIIFATAKIKAKPNVIDLIGGVIRTLVIFIP